MLASFNCSFHPAASLAPPTCKQHILSASDIEAPPNTVGCKGSDKSYWVSTYGINTKWAKWTKEWNGQRGRRINDKQPYTPTVVRFMISHRLLFPTWYILRQFFHFYYKVKQQMIVILLSIKWIGGRTHAAAGLHKLSQHRSKQRQQDKKKKGKLTVRRRKNKDVGTKKTSKYIRRKTHKDKL